MLGEKYITASGVILSRQEMGERSLWVKLFLKDHGIMNATSPSGKRGFGGDSEPLVWGVFDLKKKTKSSNYTIYDIEVNDDMFALRRDKDAMITAVKWARKIEKYLILGQPDDELLANLYWAMKLLCSHVVPAYAVNWRFIWRWLEIWGLAPDIVSFHKSMNFTDDEIILLSQISELNNQGMLKLFSVPLRLNIRENMFNVASSLAINFLNEK